VSYTAARVLEAFVPVVLLLGAGVLLGRARVLPEGAPEVLNGVVIWVCLPAAIVDLVPRVALSPELLWIAALPWALAAIGALLVRACRLPRPVEGALLLTAVLGNTSFLGYPVVRALYGEEALATAIVYDQLGSFLLLSTYASVVLARWGGGEAPSLGALAAKVVRFPPLAALALAIALSAGGIALPAPLAGPVAMAGGAMLPLVLLALGLGLKMTIAERHRRPLAIGLGLKLIVLPALALAALSMTSHGEPARVALLESAMPPMVTAGVLAAGADLEPDLSYAMTGLGLVLSMVTLPIWAWIASALP
jgi:predicted permease